MKGHVKAIIMLLVCLAVLLPFASNAPDGLEKVAETLHIQENESSWKGLMPNYSIPTIDNPYASTFLAGALGTILVLSVAFITGKAITKQKKT